MTEEQQRVHEVMARLSELHYLGKIKALAIVGVLDDGKLEMGIGMPSNTAFGIVAGLEIIKYKVMNVMLTQGETPIEDNDI